MRTSVSFGPLAGTNIITVQVAVADIIMLTSSCDITGGATILRHNRQCLQCEGTQLSSRSLARLLLLPFACR